MRKEVEEMLRPYNDRIIVVDDEILTTKKVFKEEYRKLYDILKAGFEDKDVRDYIINFKFHSKDEDVFEMPLRYFVINLIFWRRFMTLDAVDSLCEKYIFDAANVNRKLIKTYIDEKIIKPFGYRVTNTERNKLCHNLIYDLSKISLDFNIILALTINTESFLDVYRKNDRFKELLNTKIDESMQPNEIEEYLDSRTDELTNILSTEPNVLKPFLKAGAGIKGKQMGEFFISGGLKSTLSGKTIPVPVNSNFFMGGLGNVTNYFLDSINGRKSLIMNYKEMGKSGHFSRNILLLTAQLQLSDVEDCGTVRPIYITIKDKNYLSKLIGRYYKLDGDKYYKKIVGNELELIGKEILLRSPVSCACENNKVCRMCYGDLSNINNDLNSIGALGAIKTTEPIGQNILSTKHLTTTNSELIKFTPDFYRFFTLSANEILLQQIIEDEDKEELDLSNYSLVILRSDMKTLEDFSEDSFNHYVTKFFIQNNKTKELYPVYKLTDEDGSDVSEYEEYMFLSPELYELINERNKRKGRKSKEIIIPLTDFDEGDRVFIIEIENNELAKSMKKIEKLIDRKDRLGVDTIDGMVSTLLDLFIDSHLNLHLVHGELILNRLIRYKGNQLRRPDFKNYNEINEYEILRAKKALEQNPSITTSMSFQYLSRQLTSTMTYRKKDKSFLDSFFK